MSARTRTLKAPLSAHTFAVLGGEDAANRQMRAAGRTRWNRSDYALACNTQNELTVKIGSPLERLAALECLGRMDDVAALKAAIKAGRVTA